MRVSRSINFIMLYRVFLSPVTICLTIYLPNQMYMSSFEEFRFILGLQNTETRWKFLNSVNPLFAENIYNIRG